MLCIMQTSIERSEIGANTLLLRGRRQMPLWHLSACTGGVYLMLKFITFRVLIICLQICV